MGFVDLETNDLPAAIMNYYAHSAKLDVITSDPWLAYSLFQAMSLGLLRE